MSHLTLNQLDARSASLLKRLVRDALTLVRQPSISPHPADAKSWPAGYFEQTVGGFANEPLDISADPPPPPNPP